MKKILLCGMKYDKNFGDSIINDCCKSIIEEIFIKNDISKYEIHEVDLCGRKNFDEIMAINENIKKYTNKFIFKSIRKINLIIIKKFSKKIYDFFEMINWYFSEEYIILNKYYKHKIKDMDAIIFVGGGMVKYRYQNCYHYINFITKLADKNNIPVCLNAVGVEGYEEKNIKCRLLKKALNRKCVRMITTRDDIETLKKYLNSDNNVIYKKVSDPAVCASETYGIQKESNSEIVGIGVCREKLFLDNNINYNKEDLINLWKSIINLLEENNIKWKIYTNGLEDDNKFAIELIAKLHLDINDLLIPKNPKDLVEKVAGFKGIIATRLHSCIVAYSLNIPAVGLVWNRKLKMFGESIGYGERFVEVKDFNAEFIVDMLKKSLGEGYSKVSANQYINTDKNALMEFLNLYCKK